jgi:hypothetical protein
MGGDTRIIPSPRTKSILICLVSVCEMALVVVRNDDDDDDDDNEWASDKA